MKFTNRNYIDLIKTIKDSGYYITDYTNFGQKPKELIIRHDVDFSLEKALEMAIIEKEANVSSTYFILISSPFYNVNEKKSNQILRALLNMGHHIGLHFDQTVYEVDNIQTIHDKAKYEAKLLSLVLNYKVSAISFHRPSKFLLDSDIDFGDNIINTYSKKFFKDISYISDSRMNWKINPIDTINEGNKNRIQLLVHPIWYNENELSTTEVLSSFLKSSIENIYFYIDSNFTNLSEFLPKERVVNSDDKMQFN
ncbi:MAG: hypothetical protein RBQ97_11830 [Acholeplasma sp.]|nr:hypothetical protein [Acholeplasma sp.]